MTKKLIRPSDFLKLMDTIVDAFNNSIELFDRAEKAKDYEAKLELLVNNQCKLLMQLVHVEKNILWASSCITCKRQSEYCDDMKCPGNVRGDWWTAKFESESNPDLNIEKVFGRTATDAIELILMELTRNANGHRFNYSFKTSSESKMRFWKADDES